MAGRFAISIAGTVALLCGAAPAFADAPQLSGGMIVSPQSAPLTLVSSVTLPDGLIQNDWTVQDPAGGTLTVTAASLSEVTVDTPCVTQCERPTEADTEVSPPESLLSNAAAGPKNHTWYNLRQVQRCTATCVYASSDQYAIQEVPGDWRIGNHITGNVHPGNNDACYGRAWNTFGGEHGDSGPDNFKPAGDTFAQGSSLGWAWTFSYGVFSFSESGTTASHSKYGPIAPSGWTNPAYGSHWDGIDYGGDNNNNNALGSGDDIKLGVGQSAYNNLWIGYPKDKYLC